MLTSFTITFTLQGIVEREVACKIQLMTMVKEITINCPA